MSELKQTDRSQDTKYALVTGAGARVGRAIALELARHGFYVLVHYHQNQAGAQTTLEQVKALGGDGQIISANLGDEADRLALISATQQACPTLNLLVNRIELDSFAVKAKATGNAF